jgi:hypothetical protein
MPVVIGLAIVVVCLVLMGWAIGHYGGRRSRAAQ